VKKNMKSNFLTQKREEEEEDLLTALVAAQ